MTPQNFLAVLSGDASKVKGGSGKVLKRQVINRRMKPHTPAKLVYLVYWCVFTLSHCFLSFHSGPNDHVFVYFTDHGAPGILAFPNDDVRIFYFYFVAHM